MSQFYVNYDMSLSQFASQIFSASFQITKCTVYGRHFQKQWNDHVKNVEITKCVIISSANWIDHCLRYSWIEHRWNWRRLWVTLVHNYFIVQKPTLLSTSNPDVFSLCPQATEPKDRPLSMTSELRTPRSCLVHHLFHNNKSRFIVHQLDGNGWETASRNIYHRTMCFDLLVGSFWWWLQIDESISSWLFGGVRYPEDIS